MTNAHWGTRMKKAMPCMKRHQKVEDEKDNKNMPWSSQKRKRNAIGLNREEGREDPTLLPPPPMPKTKTKSSPSVLSK